jgi:hypothetical protein
LSIFAVILGVPGAVSLGIGLYYMPASDQSSFTQSHGCGDTATVAGHDSTTVHISNQVSYAKGQVLTVLVDPDNPAYAEIPGSQLQDMPSTLLNGCGTSVLEWVEYLDSVATSSASVHHLARLPAVEAHQVSFGTPRFQRARPRRWSAGASLAARHE